MWQIKEERENQILALQISQRSWSGFPRRNLPYLKLSAHNSLYNINYEISHSISVCLSLSLSSMDDNSYSHYYWITTVFIYSGSIWSISNIWRFNSDQVVILSSGIFLVQFFIFPSLWNKPEKNREEIGVCSKGQWFSFNFSDQDPDSEGSSQVLHWLNHSFLG